MKELIKIEQEKILEYCAHVRWHNDVVVPDLVGIWHITGVRTQSSPNIASPLLPEQIYPTNKLPLVVAVTAGARSVSLGLWPGPGSPHIPGCCSHSLHLPLSDLCGALPSASSLIHVCHQSPLAWKGPLGYREVFCKLKLMNHPHQPST